MQIDNLVTRITSITGSNLYLLTDTEHGVQKMIDLLVRTAAFVGDFGVGDHRVGDRDFNI